MARQALNVAALRMLGTQVVGVDSGSRTLKDAINEAMRDWSPRAHHALSSRLRSRRASLSTMVRDFQSVNRPRSPRANPRRRKTPAHASFRLRWRRFEFHRPSFTISSAMPT